MAAQYICLYNSNHKVFRFYDEESEKSMIINHEGNRSPNLAGKCLLWTKLNNWKDAPAEVIKTWVTSI